jgi:ABC-type multidrug transport system permease subunit
MSRSQYLLSFLLSRLVFLVAEVVVLVGFGALVFGVPVRGSLVTLAVVCLLSALAFSAVGLLVSSRAKTVEAVSGLANLVMLPMWIFSGIFFSSSNFPTAFQPVIRALPLTATADALRATMLQGAPLTALGGQLTVIAIVLVGAFVVALRIFRWR